MKVQSHQTGINMPQKSMRYWWQKRLQMSSCTRGKTCWSTDASDRFPAGFLCTKEPNCVHRSFDDDYESEELQVPGEIANKMDKLVISDLMA